MNPGFFRTAHYLHRFRPIFPFYRGEGKMFQPMALTLACHVGRLCCFARLMPIPRVSVARTENNRKQSGEQIIRTLEKGFEPKAETSPGHSTYRIVVQCPDAYHCCFCLQSFGRVHPAAGMNMTFTFTSSQRRHSSLKPLNTLPDRAKVLSCFPRGGKGGAGSGVADVPTDPMPMDIADVLSFSPFREPPAKQR